MKIEISSIQKFDITMETVYWFIRKMQEDKSYNPDKVEIKSCLKH